jgi:hypothetical protein
MSTMEKNLSDWLNVSLWHYTDFLFLGGWRGGGMVKCQSEDPGAKWDTSEKFFMLISQLMNELLFSVSHD